MRHFRFSMSNSSKSLLKVKQKNLDKSSHIFSGIERDLEIEDNDEENSDDEMPSLPENVARTLSESTVGNCTETNATKNEGRLMELIRWPLNFAAETSTNIRTHSEQATNFVFDIAVRQMHARGLIKRLKMIKNSVIVTSFFRQSDT